jgi:VWFA-related protein
MKKRILTISVVIAISLLLVLFARAQQAQQATDGGPASFQSNSNLVILDVTVLDKSGKIVSGLNKGDFQVLEDGKAQKIDVFEFQKLENDSAASAMPAAPPTLNAGSMAVPKVAVAKGIAPSKPGAVRFQDRRLVVMLFDLSSMQPDDQVHANEAAIKFLNQSLQPNDVVAIMVNSTSLNVAQDFTNDKDALIAVVKKLSI